jgi:hypothetical protein
MNSGSGEMPMIVADGERDALMARYLAGRLSDDEAERFESWWAQHPELTPDLEATARLASGLRDMRRRGELTAAVRGGWWARPLALLSIAAGVAAVAAGAVAWLLTVRTPEIPLAGAVASLPRLAAGQLPIGGTYSLLRLRAAVRADATLELPAGPRAIALRVLPEQSSASGRYRVELAREESRNAGVALDLRAADDGFVDVFVDSRALSPGRYRLAIAPEESVASGSVFVLDVRAGPESR